MYYYELSTLRRPSTTHVRTRRRHAVALALAPLLIAALLAGCGVAPTSPPSPSQIVLPTPTPPRPQVTQAVGEAASQLLATLPEVAGGVHLDGVQVVDDAFHVGHRIDDVLEELHKERREAVSVFRYGEDATVGATAVEGIDGATLLGAFVTTWNAPAVIERLQRLVGGSVGWELRDRGGRRTVIYRLANVVYLVESSDAALLEVILPEMPPFGVR